MGVLQVVKGAQRTLPFTLWLNGFPLTGDFTLAPTPRTPMNSESSLSEAAPKPYTSFSAAKKRYIVFTAAGAGLFSSLSAQIYFPSLNTLAEDLNVSASLVNLTVTSYMVSLVSSVHDKIESNTDVCEYTRSSKELLPCSSVILQTERVVGQLTSFASQSILPRTLLWPYRTVMQLSSFSGVCRVRESVVPSHCPRPLWPTSARSRKEGR